MTRSLRLVSAAVVSLALGLIACALTEQTLATPVPTESPTPTVTPSPTPTPTPAPAQFLAEGDAALFNGDWDTALTAYASASSAGDETTSEKAELGKAKVLIDAGRLVDAVTTLDFFLVSHPTGPEAARASLLRARVRETQGDAGGAVADYDAYRQLGPGVIDGYVQEWAGDALRDSGDSAGAAARYLAAADLARLGDSTSVRFKAGRALIDAGQPGDALPIFDGIFQGTLDPNVRAAANYYTGQALEAMGDKGGAYAHYLDSVNNYPEAHETYLGLVELVNADVPVDDFQRGRIDLNVGAAEPAVSAFTRVIDASPSSRAYYLRGLARRAAGDPSGAIDDFVQVYAGYADAPEKEDAWMDAGDVAWFDLGDERQAIQIYQQFADSLPASSRAPEALFNAGRAAELSGDLPGAADLFDRLSQAYPSSALASSSSLRAGLGRYRLGDLDNAHQAFLRAGELAQSGGDRAAAAYWTGKVLQALNRPDEAIQAWTSAAASDPTGYYSVRAEDQLAGRGPLETSGVPAFPAGLDADRDEAESWLRSHFPITATEPLHELTPSLADDPRVLRGEELSTLGLVDEAHREFESLRQDYSGDAEASFRLMHRFLEDGFYDLAIRAARTVLDLAGLDDAGTFTAPRYFNEIRFGPYFGDLILPEALDEGFDPLFLFAVVRQESLFQGGATSTASARGLMQVIPSTGEAIAAELGWPPGYTEADLHRPIVSIRFGTHYLAKQRDGFGGDLMTALAAYNGGPGNAATWQERAAGDPDLLLEVIGYQETRNYLRTITEVYDIYRNLYAPG
jgi:soluble lytic murein transglycosylase